MRLFSKKLIHNSSYLQGFRCPPKIRFQLCQSQDTIASGVVDFCPDLLSCYSNSSGTQSYGSFVSVRRKETRLFKNALRSQVAPLLEVYIKNSILWLNDC